MSGLMDFLFGALSSDYCLYFYLLEILAFVSIIYIVIVVLFSFRTFKNKMVLLSLLVGPVIVYFESRLLYSMCMNSTQKPMMNKNMMDMNMMDMNMMDKNMMDMNMMDKNMMDMNMMDKNMMDMNMMDMNMMNNKMMM